ncbi:MAG TPA: DUF4352 domain-containing protein [Pyrinomonadaceae bacterium]|jgi:Domain of unknown function (DUF4352)|nr:DUF4352 domain-containing protein [Pyrinomonadaceae bacterium]
MNNFSRWNFNRVRVNSLLNVALIGVISVALILGCKSSANSGGADPNSGQSQSKTGHATGENVKVGYMEYKVFDSWFTNQLSDKGYPNTPPDAQYLFVDLQMQNDDKEQRTVPEFKLIDENNAEYGTTDKAWGMDGSVGLFQDLNPGVAKRGFVVFDVPQNHKYKLKVSGGYWATDEALIDLAPSVKKKGK